MTEKNIVRWNEEKECFDLQLFSGMIGNQVLARIGKKLAQVDEVDHRRGDVDEDIKEYWKIRYQHPEKKDLQFTAMIKRYEDYIEFESIQHFSISGKSGKSMYGNPYISFPEFSGEPFLENCSCLTYKRQAPFNYPVRWNGKVTDSLREGKNIPLVIMDRGYRTIILSPLNHLLHGTVSISKHPESVRCGIPRAVEALEAETSMKTVLVYGQGVTKMLHRWGEILREHYGTKKIPLGADTALKYLSYWTNAGSAYWYRGHKNYSYEDTLSKLVSHYKVHDIPIGSYQLDSWWYQKDGNRYTSGITSWEPKKETIGKNFNSLIPLHNKERKTSLFTEDRLSYVQRILKKPIGAHFKQLSNDAVYVKGRESEFIRDPFSIPKNEDVSYQLFKEIFTHPKWELSYVIHDWLSYMYDHHPALRNIDVAEGYLRGMDRAALEIPATSNASGHLSLQLCMTQPHLTLFSVTMQSVSHIRSTSDSRSFFVEGKKRWRWHFYSSVLIHALGKYPFYDHRHSRKSLNLHKNRQIELELIWIALSGGPLGLGDKIGQENNELIMKFVKKNGEILRPDHTAMPLDRCFWNDYEDPSTKEAATVVASSEIPYFVGRGTYRIYYLLDMNLRKGIKKVNTFYSLAEVINEEELYRKWDYVLYEPKSDLMKCVRTEERIYNKKEIAVYQYRLIAPLRYGFAFFGDCSMVVAANNQLFTDLKFDPEEFSFTMEREEEQKTSRIVIYSEIIPKTIRVEEKIIDFQYDQGKVEFEITQEFVGFVTVYVTRK